MRVYVAVECQVRKEQQRPQVICMEQRFSTFLSRGTHKVISKIL